MTKMAARRDAQDDLMGWMMRFEYEASDENWSQEKIALYKKEAARVAKLFGYTIYSGLEGFL